MHFVVTAYDFKDGDTINRRLTMRDKHLGGLRGLADNGHFLSGGAILDKEGKMIGSTAHVSFESRDALDEWVKNDPYVTGRVWDHIDVREVALFPVSD